MAAKPSSVVTARSPTPPTGRQHERAATPSTNTRQAPHSPSPQPNLGPFSPRSLRSTCSSGAAGGTASSCKWPLTRRAMAALLKSARQASSRSLDWMRLTPLAVICFQAAASEPFRLMPRQASSITATSKPALRASMAVQATQKSVANPAT